MIRNKKANTLAKKIIASWPCLDGPPLNKKGRQISKKKKPDKCYR